MVVTGAAGAVGSLVGQIAKIKGLRVIGIAGSDDKTDYITKELGFDAAINYKTTPDIAKAIAELAPNGVDIHFDNVGGEISDAVLANLNRYASHVSRGMRGSAGWRSRWLIVGFAWVLLLFYRFGRIACCGAISTYNATSPPVGPRDEWALITRSIKKQGFIVTQWQSEAPEFFSNMSEWVRSGKIKVRRVPRRQAAL